MIAIPPLPSRLSGIVGRLRRDRSGLAMLEFAFTLPIVLAIGGWGVELSNLALCNLRVSQYALNLADNASRVGQDAGSVTNLREADINDVLQGAKLEGAAINLTTRGRITVSSLEADANGNQTIHWQRCLGAPKGPGYDSSYGITATNNRSDGQTYDPTAGVNTAGAGNPDNSSSHPGSIAVGTTTNPGIGMGDPPPSVFVKAPANSGVMFVEINYLYKPLFGSVYLGSSPRVIHYIASFIVRDARSFAEIYNPSPQVPPDSISTCDKHAA